MNARQIFIDLVGSPQHLPRPHKGRVAVLDIAFASGEKFDRVTEPFIRTLGNRLALWCDHHEHPLGWAKYRADPRFLLVPNREAHACPELVTPQVAARAGRVDALVVHGDFDGMLTAVKLLREGQPPYPEADEDARAIDSPGRGHPLSDRGRRLAHAVDEAVASFTAGQRRDFMTAVIWALVEGREPPELTRQIDAAASTAEATLVRAERAAREQGRVEAPGLYVVRLVGRRKGRERKAILRFGEELCAVAAVIETEGPNTWVTVATYDPRIDLNRVASLDGGRSDFRYAEPRGPVEPILREVARVMRESID